MNRVRQEVIFARVGPALLAGALAGLIAWGAAALSLASMAHGGWIGATVCWTLAFILPGAWVSVRGALAAHVAAAGVWIIFLLTAKDSWPPAQIAWLLTFMGAALLFVRRAVLCGDEQSAGGEAARMLLVGAAAWWACRPMFTSNLIGGLDARWYAYTLFDFIEQLRAGVFPVLVGQGPYQFNGAVHPFRFAPYFQYLAGALDFATGRSLGGFALQHLTVIVSAFWGAAAMYFSLASLAPRLRWTAALVAACYILCPVWLGFLSFLDMYMSYMTVAWLPIVFWGMARWFDRRDATAHVLVAGALSILWTCHAPVALWASMIVFGVMGAGWIAQGATRRGAIPLVAMLALFCALSAYYFYGIVEVSPPAANAPREGQAVACAIFAGVAVVLWLVAKRVFPLTTKIENHEARRALWLLFAGGGALAVAGVGGSLLAAAKDGAVVGAVAYTKIFWPAVFWPVHTPGALFSDVQPGYALWMLAALGLCAAVLVCDARAKLLGLALVLLTCFLLPFSHATEALWSLLPTSLLVATSGAVNLRLSPVWVTLMAVSGFCALAHLAKSRPRWHRFFVVALMALIPWSAWEASKHTTRLAALESSPAASENFRRPENATLFIYSGNQIGSPAYFSHGVRDYRLESRVLDPVTFAISPELGRAGPPPIGKEVVLTMKLVGGAWEIEPTLTLLRDAPWLTVWKFSEAVPEGVLTLSATDLYREYALPSSGGSKSFGSGPTNSRELPLWTTSPFPEEITLRILPAKPPAPGTAPRELARVELRPLTDNWLPVRTLSLVPGYHATVDARAPALLETCRTWLPGYRVTRNGREVSPVRTPEGLVGVPLEPGPNDVVVRFDGTSWLRRMFFVSLVTWACVVTWLVAKVRAKYF